MSLPSKRKPAKKRKDLLHPSIRKELDVPSTMSDAEFLKTWREASRRVCKPCWELKYCPYGPLVEQFPLLPVDREVTAHHIEHLKRVLATGKFPDGSPLDPARRRMFKKEVASFKPEDYPESIPEEIGAMACNIFGHICPVMFVNEGFTETSELRRKGRYIPFKTKFRVVRRDNYTCQHCGKHLRDDEVEFDHVIPLARGGSSEEHNIRLTCFDCNRDKSDKVDI